MELIHDEFGHLGVDRTTGLMQERFYWPHMSDDIRMYIRDCMRCIKFKQKGEQEEMVSIKATYPLQLVHMDFLQIGSKRADKGKPIYVLVITDHFTRYAQAYVTTNQTAHTVADVFINKYVVNYGWPEKILTDQAQDFEGKVFKQLCDQALIKKLRTSPYHPQGNGQPEWFNRTLLTMLGTLPNDAKKKWGEWVAILTQAYNCSPSRVTGYSPYFLMFGREPRIPADQVFDTTPPEVGPSEASRYLDFVTKLRARINWAYKIANKHIEKDAMRRKLYYDRKFHCMEIIPGDIVLVRQKVFGNTRKIEDRWENPIYKVVEKQKDGPVYKVQRFGHRGEDSFRELHQNMLFPILQVAEEERENQDPGDTEPEVADTLELVE